MDSSQQYTYIHLRLGVLLQEAILFGGATKGMIQLYDVEKKRLEVVAQVGFGDTFLSLFRSVKAFDPSACGRALGIKAPIAINDVYLETAFAPFMDVVKAEGFHSVKSMPLFSDSHDIVGILSIHFPRPLYLMETVGEIPAAHLIKIAQTLQDLTLKRKDIISEEI